MFKLFLSKFLKSSTFIINDTISIISRIIFLNWFDVRLICFEVFSFKIISSNSVWFCNFSKISVICLEFSVGFPTTVSFWLSFARTRLCKLDIVLNKPNFPVCNNWFACVSFCIVISSLVGLCCGIFCFRISISFCKFCFSACSCLFCDIKFDKWRFELSDTFVESEISAIAFNTFAISIFQVTAKE